MKNKNYTKELRFSESELIEACVKEDRRAQREVYEKYSSRMYSICIRYMGDRERAKDMLQDGFVNLFFKIKSYSGEGSFEGWARKIFVNTCLMEMRRRDALKESEDIEEMFVNSPSEENILGSLGYKDIMKLIEEMPDGFRIVFNMNAIEGYSHQEIAEHLGISEGASRSQLSRARSWLQGKIKRYE